MSYTILSPDTKAPKVLGDLIESIAGAILIDSKLNVDQVWEILKPLLSPIVTPEKLELPPSRELMELCDSLGYFIKEEYSSAKGDSVHAELRLQLEDVLLQGRGSGPNRKAAKGLAALQLLKKLEVKGILSSKRRKNDVEQVDEPVSQSETSNTLACKKHKIVHLLPQKDGDKLRKDHSKTEIPVLPPIEMKKGGPRTSLFALCKKQQWPMPTFDTTEQKSRTPIQFGDMEGFNSFESEISLTIPDFGIIKLTGEARADKKSSFDSSALLMLYELERQEMIVTGY